LNPSFERWREAKAAAPNAVVVIDHGTELVAYADDARLLARLIRGAKHFDSGTEAVVILERVQPKALGVVLKANGHALVVAPAARTRTE
jgi:hypothetical protein